MHNFEIETELFEFLKSVMNSGKDTRINRVQRFDDYLASEDYGIVIDLEDGTQIRLTIQTA